MRETSNICIMLGTTAPGGIQSVVNIYRELGLFDELGILFFSSHEELSGWKKLKITALLFFKLLILFCTKPISVVHLHVAAGASFWRKALFIAESKLFRKKVIFHLHGSEFKQFYEQHNSRFIRGLIRRIINWSDVIIVLSPEWLDWIKNKVAVSTPIEVVENFVPPVTRDGVQREQMPTFLSLGKVGSRKGSYDLIKAFSEVRRQLVCKLWIAGDGEIAQAQALVDELGLADDVTLFGWVGPEKRNELLALSNIYILPSYNEGQPMSIIEAMSANLPTISTTVGGIPNLITQGEEGFLVEPGDVERLVHYMKLIVEDEGLRSRMGELAMLKYNRFYSPATGLDKIRQIYGQLQ